MTDGRNSQTLWNRNAYGLVTSKTLLANQGGSAQEVLKYYYDAEARLTNRWSMGKGGAGYNTYYAYDPVGNVTNIAYPTLTNTYKYDALNRLTNMSDSLGATTLTWTDGSQLRSEFGRWTSDKVTWSYLHRQLTNVSLQRPGTSDWSQNHGYDSYGRAETISSPAGNFTYTYSFFGLPDSIQRQNGTGAYITRDGIGRVIQRDFLGSYFYDTHGYTYDAGSQRTQQVSSAYAPDGSFYNYRDYSYDNIGQLKTAKGFEQLGGTRRHEQFGYAYDASWNLLRRTNNNLVAHFQANGLNQVTNYSRTGTLTVSGSLYPPSSSASVSVSGTGLSSTAADLYTDGAWASQNGATPADGLNSYTAKVVDNGQTNQQSVSVYLPASLTFRYDFNGNLTNDGVRTFEYDFENQLTNVFVANSWRSEFKYDGLGRRRVRKEYTWSGSAWSLTNEVRYIYDGRVVIQERDASNNPKVTYTRGLDLSLTREGAGGIGGLLARTDTSGSAYYHCDAQGNITCMLDGNNNVVARYRYDPYGNILAMNGSLAAANLYRFSSKEYHPNSGLVYYLYRYYEPSLQRWVNRDPIGLDGGLNLYSFSENEPITNVDPFGLRCYPADFIGPLQPGDWRYNEGGPYLLSPDQINAFMDWWNKYIDPPPPPGCYVGMCPPIGPGRSFTRDQKVRILDENMQRNSGVLKSDLSGKELVRPQQHQKGVTPPSNEAHVDHKVPRSKGGQNSRENAQVLSRQENLGKSDKMPPDSSSNPPQPGCDGP